jgi:hypothetical protein
MYGAKGNRNWNSDCLSQVASIAVQTSVILRQRHLKINANKCTILLVLGHYRQLELLFGSLDAARDSAVQLKQIRDDIIVVHDKPIDDSGLSANGELEFRLYALMF